MTVRVTAGELRGRRIPVPPRDVRPTSERARQAFFNIVSTRIVEANFLDLFAGSGVFSFEAVSRGATSATAIESDRRHASKIAELATEWKVPVKVITADVFIGLKRLNSNAFDLVYADPPYDFAKYDQLLLAIDEHVPLAADALVAIEHESRNEPFTAETKRLVFHRRAEYGHVSISFFAAA